MNSIKTVVVLGAGNRGKDAYGKHIIRHPGEIKAVAVAEPDPDKRHFFATEHKISKEYQFKRWEDVLAKDKLADGIIIATLDNMHLEPALSAMGKGYKILLEKPIAPTLAETIKIVQTIRDTQSQIILAYVLRYTNFYQQLKKMIQRDDIGEIRFVDHIENIGFYHYAHSYVRGNWRNTDTAAPIILAKSCHDLDIIYWLLGKKCLELFSQASLEYFTGKNHPAGAGKRCLFCGVEDDCPYSARKIYLTENNGWPASVISSDLSYEGRYRALETGPYGRCVFKCDNNVPEVQSVSMKLVGNTQVNFALTAFSKEINRTSRFYGTKGEIRADFEAGLIEVLKFDGSNSIVKVDHEYGGHGGGDTGLMNHFVQILQGDESKNIDADSLVEGHLLAFAAEMSQEQGKPILLEELRKRLKNKSDI